MDIVAKKAAPDKDGVRIAELNEDSYKYLLWDHRPLTDFWQIGPGKARRLARGFMFTMGEVADRSLYDEEWFYKTFGIDAEILIDHAWGIEPVTMRDIKSYRSDSHSLSNGQVLPRPYRYVEARIVFSEMIEGLCADMFMKNLVSPAFTWWVSYDYKSLEACPSYDGPLTIDFYGRLHPVHSSGTVRLPERTNSAKTVTSAVLAQFDAKVGRMLLFRRLGICANMPSADDGIYQLNLFTAYDALEREKSIQRAMLTVRRRYGPNAIFTGKDLLEGATTLERNLQIGGHKA
jgi:DNA polymerase V